MYAAVTQQQRTQSNDRQDSQAGRVDARHRITGVPSVEHNGIMMPGSTDHTTPGSTDHMTPSCIDHMVLGSTGHTTPGSTDHRKEVRRSAAVGRARDQMRVQQKLRTSSVRTRW